MMILENSGHVLSFVRIGCSDILLQAGNLKLVKVTFGRAICEEMEIR